MKIKIFYTALVIFFSCEFLISQNFNKNKLDSLFALLDNNNKSMGSIALSKNGNILYCKSIGYSYISDNDKKIASENTKYRIGSISKMFTATMIFQLIQEKKIKLSTTLDQFFPDIPNSKIITLGDLLNHRSGIYNFTNDPEYPKWMTQHKTQEEILNIISKYPSDFKPNTKGSYSNSNYVLLGYIIEKVTKKSYANNLIKRVVLKAGLSNTYLGAKADINKNESYSYIFSEKWNPLPETDMSIPGGAGAIVSTPVDLVKFSEALFSLKLVSQNSLDQMKSITDGFGMGMLELPFFGKKSYGHLGGIDGFVSSLAYFPEDSITISYCCNGQSFPLNNVINGVLKIYYNSEYSLPNFKTIYISQADLNKYVGVYTCSQLPIKITISNKDSKLFAQATGQAQFVLEPTEKDKFKFDLAGIKIDFFPEKNEMTLKQGGGTYIFIKEKSDNSNEK